MTKLDTLYTELKPDIEVLAGSLFDLSRQFLEEIGNFLPHAAVLKANEEVVLVGASPQNEDGHADSTEVLPILHEGLRAQVASYSIRAVAIAENVTVARAGEDSTKAIKVLFEHQLGLTVALYLPFDERTADGYTFGDIFSVAAQPEICTWNLPNLTDRS